MNLKVGDILIAKRECRMISSDEKALVIGKEYEIINIDQENEAIFIKSEISSNHRFPTKQDQKENNVDYYFHIKGKEKSLSDQEIKDYLKELITTNVDICNAVNKLSRKVKKLSKPSNYDLSNMFGDHINELDKIMANCYKSQAGDKVVNETPLTDLNNEVQAAINAKDLVNKLEEFTNEWVRCEQLGSNVDAIVKTDWNIGCSFWKQSKGLKKIQATKAAIEAIQFILDNDLTRSEMEAIKNELNDMA